MCLKTIISLIGISLSAIASANNSTVTINDFSSGYPSSYYVNSSLKNSETHVIGVYETRSDHSFNFHPEGTALVHISGAASTPVNLVLSSYEPTKWVLDGAGLSFINSILINGYNVSRVIGIDSSKVIDKTGVGRYISACAYAWPGDNQGCNTQGLVVGVESYFGTKISTFSGDYRATDFSVALSPVPEPESYVLLLVGFGLMGFIARCRKNFAT